MKKYKSEIKEFIDFMKRKLKNVTKEEARKTLYEAGLITKNGKNKKLVTETHLI